MKERDPDAARRAVDLLASSVVPPAPPEGLRAGRSGRGPAAGLLAAAVILVSGAALMTWWTAEDPASEDVAASVVVQHLRVAGKPVHARVRSIPGSDAVVVIALDESAHGQPSSQDVALAISAGWVRRP